MPQLKQNGKAYRKRYYAVHRAHKLAECFRNLERNDQQCGSKSEDSVAQPFDTGNLVTSPTEVPARPHSFFDQFGADHGLIAKNKLGYRLKLHVRSTFIDLADFCFAIILPNRIIPRVPVTPV